jgi:hypothetical protein
MNVRPQIVEKYAEEETQYSPQEDVEDQPPHGPQTVGANEYLENALFER